MKRRSFLKSAAAMLPLAGFDPRAIAEAPPLTEGHVIGAGEDRLGEMHSRGNSTILFKVLPRETAGGLFVIEHVNLIHGGPPFHMHPHQEEYFFVIAGEVRFALGDQRLVVKGGESVLGPRGVPHTFAAVEGKPSHMLIPSFNNSAVENIAPIPMNRLWASDIWPAIPPTIFHDDARAT